jgi:hypothetical protein
VFVLQLGLQVMIGSTGGYGFFNALTACIALPLLHSPSRAEGPRVAQPVMDTMAITSLCAAGVMLLRRALTPRALVAYVSCAANVGMLATAYEMSTHVLTCFRLAMSRHHGNHGKAARLHLALQTMGATAFFLGSCVSFTGVLEGLVQPAPVDTAQEETSSVPADAISASGYVRQEVLAHRHWLSWRWPLGLRELATMLNRQGLLSGYAVFVRLGAGEARPELLLEISSSRNGPFQEVPFQFKTGRGTPGWVGPHHPILDYQLWHATSAFMAGGGSLPPWFHTLLERYQG